MVEPPELLFEWMLDRGSDSGVTCWMVSTLPVASSDGGAMMPSKGGPKVVVPGTTGKVNWAFISSRWNSHGPEKLLQLHR